MNKNELYAQYTQKARTLGIVAPALEKITEQEILQELATLDAFLEECDENLMDY